MSLATLDHAARTPRAGKTALTLTIDGVEHQIRPFDTTDGDGYCGVNHRLRAPGGRWFMVQRTHDGYHCERCGAIADDEECEHTKALELVGLS